MCNFRDHPVYWENNRQSVRAYIHTCTGNQNSWVFFEITFEMAIPMTAWLSFKLRYFRQNYMELNFHYSRVQKSIENWSVCSKMALGEVGVSVPWWCYALVFLAPGYRWLFLNLIIFHNGKMTSFRGVLGQSWNSEKKSNFIR